MATQDDAAWIRVAGLVLVRARTIGRARELAGHVENVLRSRRGPVGGVRITIGRGNRGLASMPHVTRTSSAGSPRRALGGSGVAAWQRVHAWRCGGRSRSLRPHTICHAEGRRLFLGRDHNGERRWHSIRPRLVFMPLWLARRVRVRVRLLARGILDEIARGHTAGAVIDPKADLIRRPARPRPGPVRRAGRGLGPRR